MRAFHYRAAAAVTTALLAAALTVPTIATATAGVAPVSLAAPATGHWSHDVVGCGAVSLYVPNVGQADRAHPEQLLAPALATTFKNSPITRKLVGRHVHWLSALRCVPGHPRTTPTMAYANARSANWSGYVSNAGGVTGAEQEWTVPAVREPSTKTVVSSIWPGIGTGNSKTDSLIQAGSEQDGACELGCTYHKTSYYYWIEIFPQESQQEITNLAAHQGDDASAQVSYTASNHTGTFEVCDYTENSCVQGSQAIQSGGASGSGAEWILERTESCGASCTFPSLNNFGTETIYNADAVLQGAIKTIPQTGATAWDMWNCAYTTQLDRTNGLSSGTAFSITWLAFGSSDHC